MSDELQKVRERLHKLADDQQEHRMKIAEHELRLSALAADVLDMRDSAATRDQLASLEALLTLKLDQLAKTIEPIRSGINKLVWVIVVAILMALLGLVLVKPGVFP